MSSPDNFDRLYQQIDILNAHFPEGNTPFHIITRLCEEAGELAAEVNHFEGIGLKRQKRGEPDKMTLAKEVEDVIKCALSIARYYSIEQELNESIELNCRKIQAMNQGES